ncbi:hypothetical protein [Natrinema sp. DC36]|uniref:hypothetical protein n=1 Tax=Natrinema sp. DC36 TaxID=2878680 RepID=UPI001CEFC433|nr:hypothetical protein [Natrinema sp. DC36]
MESKIIVVGAFVLFGAILVPAISGAFADAPAETEVVDNESVSISTASWEPVSKSSVATQFYDNETVYSNGSVVAESNYEWETSNGSIRAVENGTLEDTDEVAITYAYDEGKSDWLNAGSSVLGLLFTIIAIFSLIAGAMTLLVAITGIVDNAGGGR